MARSTIASPDIAWGPLPISQAVRTGNLAFVSGIPGFTRDFQLAKGDFDAQMRQAMENVGVILRAAGSEFERVVKCTVLLARQKDWAAMNQIYKTYWPKGDYPARTAFASALPHPDFLVEVECVAEVGWRCQSRARLVAARSSNVLASCRRAISRDWLKSASASSTALPSVSRRISARSRWSSAS